MSDTPDVDSCTLDSLSLYCYRTVGDDDIEANVAHTPDASAAAAEAAAAAALAAAAAAAAAAVAEDVAAGGGLRRRGCKGGRLGARSSYNQHIGRMLCSEAIHTEPASSADLD
jgi:hypothetical protein